MTSAEARLLLDALACYYVEGGADSSERTTSRRYPSLEEQANLIQRLEEVARRECCVEFKLGPSAAEEERQSVVGYEHERRRPPT